MSFTSTLAGALRRTPASRTETLRAVIDTIRTSRRLDDLPDAFANVIELYDSHNVTPTLRSDVQELLAGSVNISQVMLNPAFSVDDALTLIADQQRILATILRYLSQRPQKIGYSILSCKNQTLLGHFGTQAEAAGQLAQLQAAGHCPNSLVVPVKITSQFAVRPDETGGATHMGGPLLDDPIPSGVKPEHRTLEPLEPFDGPSGHRLDIEQVSDSTKPTEELKP